MEKKEAGSQNRRVGLDLLRILACFMVVFLHVSTQNWYITDVTTSTWKFFNFYDSLCRSCVPVFFMISGALFLGKQEMPSIRTLFEKYILKILLVYFVWSFLYAVDTLGIQRIIYERNTSILLHYFVESKYHLWYLPALLGIYCLLPILWSISRYQEGKYLPYACIMFLIFAILKNTALLYPFQSDYVPTLISKFSYALCEYSGYFLMGHYLDTRCQSKLKKSYLCLLFLIVVLVSAKLDENISVLRGAPQGLLYGYMSLPVFLEALLLFLLFKNVVLNSLEKHSDFVKKISKCTFIIYLLHPFIIEHLDSRLQINTLSFHAALSVPVISLAVFLCCLVISAIFQQIMEMVKKIVKQIRMYYIRNRA